MKNKIIITHDEIRKIKNRVHKKTYDKKKGINENFINEFTIESTILGIRGIKQLGKRIINKIKKDILEKGNENKGNQQATMD